MHLQDLSLILHGKKHRLMFKSLTTYYAANTNLFMKFHTNSDLQGRRNGENRHMRNR